LGCRSTLTCSRKHNKSPSLQEAIRAAEEMEVKLAKEEEVCNDTMKTLWEECKPCLKKTCVKYYSRTCSSGSGLVGRQLEDVLNRTSPFSIWINGERIDSLEQEGQRQNKEFRNLEERYSEMADGVDNIFSDSMKVADHINPPVFFFPNFLAPAIRRARSIHLLFHDPFHNFRSLFSPMTGMGRNLFGPVDSMMDLDSDAAPNEDGNVNEDVIITRPFGNGKMTCREIRRNSAGCIKFRNECEKCKEIQHLDCSGNRPLEGPLKEELEEALAMAERFTQQYNSLLKRFEERVFNTSSLLDMLNRQFGWVSSLANNTKDGIFSVKGVISKGDTEERQGGKTKDADTKVTVQLFDSPPMNVTVRGDIPWTDPKFSEELAQKALDRYKATSILAK
ncbi:clusterin, partial [Poecilia reticulata]|uniref:clusterin n=1 Tax=Poecilia reticulata TaxID=8081 RepID=UPI0007EBE357